YPGKNRRVVRGPDPLIVGSSAHVIGRDEHILGKTLPPEKRRGSDNLTMGANYAIKLTSA
ncbi:MAG: hypothetical protein WAU20_10535, partial [Dokdonella sp.]